MNKDIFYESEKDYALSAFMKMGAGYSHYVILGNENDYLFSSLTDLFSQIHVSFSCNFEPFNSDNFCVICLAHSFDYRENLLSATESLVNNNGCGKCIIFDRNTLPVNREKLYVAEREYNFLNKYDPAFDKAKIINKYIPTVLLRSDEIVGPGCGFEKIFENVRKTDRITISDKDDMDVYGYTYIRDALTSIVMAIGKLKTGNVYNVSSFAFSVREFKQILYNLFKDKFSLACLVEAQPDFSVKSLCSLKIVSAGLALTSAEDAVYAMASSYFGFAYDYGKRLPQYCAKLHLLKKLELDILKEVDRICKKYNIKYFLSGGTLLGAVRYGRSIPWDDDLDIGMLREDFEKFRKVCPQELDGTVYAYASFDTEPDCHYLFDKIRLKNTYFSTEFSSGYRIQNGIFVDVFVYDNTFSSSKLQSLHINLVKTAIRFMNLKWTNKADKNMNGYLLSVLAKPIIKLFSFKALHSFSEKSLSLCRKNKSRYLIDGTGLNINRGAFDRKCLENLTEIDFEGITVPVPQNYDAFLKHVYGENYIEEPPVYMRGGTHDFVRLDLGEYVADDVMEATEQSLDGELF
ncbi:MAG: LicD family protein [Clostridia bacterium]|nr:LicD family protein [Clostridia bacterium]